MTLQQILHLTDPAALRIFLLEELPIRYARRVQLVEAPCLGLDVLLKRLASPFLIGTASHPCE